MSTLPTGDDAPSEQHFRDVADAADALAELPDLARVEAWASSALAVWAEAPEAATIDDEFVGWLESVDHPNAPIVLLAVSGLLGLEPEKVERARSSRPDLPAWAQQVGHVDATRAWTVDENDARSVGIGFQARDQSEHSVLADIVDGILVSLVVAPGPDELFDGAEDVVAPSSIAVADAAQLVAEAWGRLVDAGAETPESVYVNGALAYRRLSDVLGRDLRHLFRPLTTDPTEAELDDEEVAEANAWALSVLDGCGAGRGVPGSDVLLDPLVPARRAVHPAAEREAFEALEWADWLGAVIGLTRTEPGTEVDPTLLVDLVNRCPEVTSSIPRKDRPYFEWAFSMVLPLWRRGGVVDDELRLSEHGADHLVAALRQAWS